MVRHTDADDEATFELITDAAQIEEGDTVDVWGQDFLPKSNMEIVEVDPDWAGEPGTVFVAKIPNRKNAREYCFRVKDTFVQTTGSRGTWGPSVTAKVEVSEDDEDDDEDDDTAIDADDVGFDAHAIAAAWEASDSIPVFVAVAITNEFTTHDVTAAEGKQEAGDVVFPGVLFEEKAVGVCDRSVAEDYAERYVDLPNRDDGKVLAVNTYAIMG